MAVFDVSKLVQAGMDAFKNKGRGEEGVIDMSYAEIFDDLRSDLFDSKTQKAFYTVKAKNWHQTYPYRFVIRLGGAQFIYALPIPPSSYNVSTIIPSRATATLGGVVEESSEVVFFNISMQGTFGQAISKQRGETPAGRSDEFRKVFTSGGLLGSALSTLANTAGNLIKAATLQLNLLELLGNAQLPYSSSFVNADTAPSEGLIGDVISSVSNIFNPPGASDPTKLTTTGGNGFTEVHAFQNFLLAYQKLAAKSPGDYSLHFQNIKDNCEWRCILASPPTFSKNAQRPFIYDYALTLSAWNLRQLDEVVPPIDRFGPGGDLSDITSASATGAFTKMANLGATVSKALKNPASLLKIRSIG